MKQNFGPWTTAMSEGSNAQLSTFWKRRMNMLKQVRKTGTTLSKRNWFCLFVIAAACFAFPTFQYEATAQLPEQTSKNQSREQRLQKLENKLDLLIKELKALRESQSVLFRATLKQPIHPKNLKPIRTPPLGSDALSSGSNAGSTGSSLSAIPHKIKNFRTRP